MKPARIPVVMLCTLGLLTAVSVVLGTALSIKAFAIGGGYTLEISLNVLPVILAGYLYGPAAGLIVGFVANLIKWAMTGAGAFNPFIALSMGFMGATPAFVARIIHKRTDDAKRNTVPAMRTIFIGVFVGQTVFSLVVNTVLLHVMYGTPYMGLIPQRAINAAVMIPVYAWLTRECLRMLARIKN
ncbi:MAG: folate family ECF transporter S component [Oscillospiraceae bacterium]|jgi:ECF transporter S component (folate family)|nr:folate family ECF transporter S component [Oscillospiraceae bacterium]